LLQLLRLFLAHAGSHRRVDAHTPKEASLAALPAAKPATRISAKADRGGDASKKRSAPDFCNEFQPKSPFFVLQECYN
jgi:hypothetical protein